MDEKGGGTSTRNSPLKGRMKGKGAKAGKSTGDDLELEKTEESEKYAAYRNQRLMTPRMKKIMNKKDAACMLKDEITESLLRLKAAKFGHSVEEIAPQYTNSYYLPDKSNYAPAKSISKGPHDAHRRFKSQGSALN